MIIKNLYKQLRFEAGETARVRTSDGVENVTITGAGCSYGSLIFKYRDSKGKRKWAYDMQFGRLSND